MKAHIDLHIECPSPKRAVPPMEVEIDGDETFVEAMHVLIKKYREMHGQKLLQDGTVTVFIRWDKADA